MLVDTFALEPSSVKVNPLFTDTLKACVAGTRQLLGWLQGLCSSSVVWQGCHCHFSNVHPQTKEAQPMNALSPTLHTGQVSSLTLCTQPCTYILTYVPRINWASTIPYWKYTPSRCVNEEPHRPNESNKGLFHTWWRTSLSKCLTTCTVQEPHCSVTWTSTKPYPHVWCDNAPITLHVHVLPHISGVRCTK